MEKQKLLVECVKLDRSAGYWHGKIVIDFMGVVDKDMPMMFCRVIACIEELEGGSSKSTAKQDKAS